MSSAAEGNGFDEIAVIMCCFDRGSADNESEQQHRKRAGKRGTQ